MAWRQVRWCPPSLNEVNTLDEPCSGDVLVALKSGKRVVATATLENDDGLRLVWRTTCSENWDITDEVLFWTPLHEMPSPDGSNVLPNQLPQRVLL